jgi:cell wall-associated NlpC family hydrolase
VIFASALTSVANAQTRTHTVVPGETLAAIAAREHVSVDELTRINQITGTAAVEPGAVLALDDSAAGTTAQPYAIPPATRAALRKAEVASMMPQYGDLAMWNQAPRPTHHSKAAVAEKKAEQLRRFASGIISRTSSIAMSLTRSAMRFIGTPYVFGGTSSMGFDCSGYTQHVFAMLGISLPRTADAQFYAGRPTVGGLAMGDLVFFQTYEPGPSHVGIYLGGGRFIHSSSHGVMISALTQSYWASRYLGAKRVANLR